MVVSQRKWNRHHFVFWQWCYCYWLWASPHLTSPPPLSDPSILQRHHLLNVSKYGLHRISALRRASSSFSNSSSPSSLLSPSSSPRKPSPVVPPASQTSCGFTESVEGLLSWIGLLAPAVSGSDWSLSSRDVENSPISALRLMDASLGVDRGVSIGDMSMCISVAFKGKWSGVDGGVHSCLGRGEGWWGESGDVFMLGLQRGFSISAAAIRVMLHGMLDWEEGLVTGLIRSSLGVISVGSESRQVQGVLSGTKGIESGLVLVGASESGDKAAFSPGGGSWGRLTFTVAEWELGELQGCLLCAETLLVGLRAVSIAAVWISGVAVILGGSDPGPGGRSWRVYMPGVSVKLKEGLQVPYSPPYSVSPACTMVLRWFSCGLSTGIKTMQDQP